MNSNIQTTATYGEPATAKKKKLKKEQLQKVQCDLNIMMQWCQK